MASIEDIINPFRIQDIVIKTPKIHTYVDKTTKLHEPRVEVGPDGELKMVLEQKTVRTLVQDPQIFIRNDCRCKKHCSCVHKKNQKKTMPPSRRQILLGADPIHTGLSGEERCEALSPAKLKALSSEAENPPTYINGDLLILPDEGLAPSVFDGEVYYSIHEVIIDYMFGCNKTIRSNIIDAMDKSKKIEISKIDHIVHQAQSKLIVWDPDHKKCLSSYLIECQVRQACWKIFTPEQIATIKNTEASIIEEFVDKTFDDYIAHLDSLVCSSYQRRAVTNMMAPFYKAEYLEILFEL